MGVLSKAEAQERRFDGYMAGLAKAAGHADRALPLRNYCTGLLLPGERKSVEPMAARLDANHVRRMHQSLHHLVATAPWSDEAVLAEVRGYALSRMMRKSPMRAWIVDDTGFPKKGSHSVGVARQYCGQVGKQENCRVAVSLSASTNTASLPIAFRLYLPETWTRDAKRLSQSGVPEKIGFQTKPQIALEQIRQAVGDEVTAAPVLADAGYGVDSRFRAGITELGLPYVVGVQSSTGVWAPGQAPLPAKPWSGKGRPPRRVRRSKDRQPLSAKDLASCLPSAAWRTVNWRAGTKRALKSRFAAVRVRPAHRDYEKPDPYPEEWLLMEWPKGESEPTKYWLSTLGESIFLRELVRLAKHRWIIERDYEETETGAWLGPLRRTRVAGLSSPRHPLHRRLRLPRRREKPFFPLGPVRACRITRRRASQTLSPARLAPAPSGITQIPSPLFGSASPERCCPDSLAAQPAAAIRL